MAVDELLSRETETLVLPSKSYYPLKIPIAHYQLRHFISAPEQDLVYYASGSDLFCLNAATRTQAHVASLTWEARCTASGHGYVCVGGADEGNFAAIKVAGFPPVDPTEVDALLPLELGNRRASVPRPPILGTAHRIRLEKIGEDIVNSISIHRFPAEEDGEDEVVAVLTNNDRTVRIYSLTQNLEVAVLDLPHPMNHATISPDGGMLVAVGDYPSAYFFERVRTPKPSARKTPEGRAQFISPQWTLFEEVHLYVPPGTNPSQGYFTTAWSPSGRLCAVGSECGYITVFDVELLKLCEYGEDAIVQMISSTRPDTTNGPGSVRTMQFSPAPWDLLIWSEDQARVCVADIRSGLKVKQVLNLDPTEKDLDRVEIADFDISLSSEIQDLRREADFIRRYRRALDSEGTAAAVNYATDYIEASSERRRLHRQLGVVESDNDPHGLTAHERQILEALRTTRQREEIREQGTIPRSINYTSGSSAEARRYRIASQNFARDLRNDSHNRDRDAATRRNMSDTITEFMSFHLPERSQGQGPRRRASLIISNEGSGSGSTAETTGNITDAATTRSPNPIPAHASRVDAQIIASTDSAWRTIEEALARNAQASDTTRASTGAEARAELRHLRQATQIRDRMRSARGPQLLDDYNLPALGMVYRRASRFTHHDPAVGVRTAGLAVSPDGRTLYCGTEEGIFEFHINLHERKGLPAVTPC